MSHYPNVPIAPAACPECGRAGGVFLRDPVVEELVCVDCLCELEGVA